MPSASTLVYVPDAANEWAPAEVLGQTAAGLRIQRFLPSGAVAGPPEDLPASTPTLLQNISEGAAAQEGEPDMTALGQLHEAAILYNLRKRHATLHPYTYVGEIVIAVNPYCWLPLYTDELRAAYAKAGARQRGGGRDASAEEALPPHVYATSVAAYERMAGLEDYSPQSILVSGESGAGKTETTKILMAHMAAIATAHESSAGTEHATILAIIEANPLLESFGNARTLRNDNSSRFGKFVQLQFGFPTQGFDMQRKARAPLLGALSRTYLLEKTRILSQQPGERNYHIFYQMLGGLKMEKMKEYNIRRLAKFKNSSAYQYLRNDSPGVIEGRTDEEAFARTRNALEIIGVHDEEQQRMWQLLAAVLVLGEVTFEPRLDQGEAEGGKQAVVISKKPFHDESPLSVTETVGALLGVEVPALGKAMCERTVSTRGETFTVPLDESSASGCRDALAKALYTSLFDWLVRRINTAIGAEDPSGTRAGRWVGILDIFGFEHFKVNSYEQLMINFANEKLQQKFTADVFSAIQTEYADEGITWQQVDYQDNADLLQLIEGRMGIIDFMNEEVMRGTGTDDAFVSKIQAQQFPDTILGFRKGHHQGQFTIHHYAGPVTYQASGFLAKHKDALFPDLKAMLQASSHPLVHTLFASPMVSTGSAGAVVSSAPRRRGRRDSALSAATVGTQFKQSLAELMETLATTESNYIRCIKPNSFKLPAHASPSGGGAPTPPPQAVAGGGPEGSQDPFAMVMVAEQLRCAGVVEAVRVARAAYPNRLPHKTFVERFRHLVPASLVIAGEGGLRDVCARLLGHFALKDPEEQQNGRTRVYFRGGVLERLEGLRADNQAQSARVLQRRIRGFIARSKYVRRLSSAQRIQAMVRGWLAVQLLARCVGAAIIIQTLARALVARRVCEARRREHRAMVIEAGVRCWQARRAFLTKRRSAVQIQRIARAQACRTRVQALRLERERQRNAALQVQFLKAKLEEEQAKQKELQDRLDLEAKVALEAAAQERRAAEHAAELRVEDAERDAENMREECARLRDALADARNEIVTAKAAAAQAERQRAEQGAGAMLREVTTMLEARTEERNSLKQRSDDEAAAAAVLREELARLQNAMAAKDARLIEANERVDMLQRSLENVEAVASRRLRAKQKELDTAQTQVEALRTQQFRRDQRDKLTVGATGAGEPFAISGTAAPSLGEEQEEAKKALVPASPGQGKHAPIALEVPEAKVDPVVVKAPAAPGDAATSVLQAGLCNICHTDDIKQRSQIIKCSVCQKACHTKCVGQRRIPFKLSTMKERLNRDNFIHKYFSDFRCTACDREYRHQLAASTPGGPDAGSPVNAKPIFRHSLTSASPSARHINRHRPSAPEAVPTSNAAAGPTSPPVPPPPPAGENEKKEQDKGKEEAPQGTADDVGAAVREAAEDSAKAVTKEYETKLAQAARDVNLIKEKMKLAEQERSEALAAAAAARSEVHRLTEELVQGTRPAPESQSDLDVMERDELEALRTFAETFEGEMAKLKAENDKLKEAQVDKDGSSASHEPRKSEVSEQESELHAALRDAEKKADVAESEVYREKVMRKTAEQLAAAMNEKARLELTLQKREADMEQMQRLIQRLESRLRGNAPSGSARSSNSHNSSDRRKSMSLFGFGSGKAEDEKPQAPETVRTPDQPRQRASSTSSMSGASRSSSAKSLPAHATPASNAPRRSKVALKGSSPRNRSSSDGLPTSAPPAAATSTPNLQAAVSPVKTPSGNTRSNNSIRKSLFGKKT